MRNIFIVQHRSYQARPNDPNDCVGVYTSKTLALHFAKRAIQHQDDVVTIVTQPVNQPSVSEIIWSNAYSQGSANFQQLYGAHWPASMPVVSGV